MFDANQIIADLSVFSDLGVEPPNIRLETDGSAIARLILQGNQVLLRFLPDGNVEEEVSGKIVKHATYRSLLASASFGQLREWAAVQSKVLSAMSNEGLSLEISGYMSALGNSITIEQFNDELVRPTSVAGTRIVVIDGPAGIGKTEFIRRLALLRAADFARSQRPLILHVQSRGRVLTFLQDLIAFSLQTLRLSVTFDQVPVLVRNGLVTIAIDGFDELGDPSGYETAWAQVNNLIEEIRGDGTLILAGRETFIGAERIRRDIKSIKSDDIVDSLTLRLPEPDQARTWLSQHGWKPQQLEAVAELFEPGAFSLRPLFLRRLADDDIKSRISEESGEAPLSLLVDLMVEREAEKFGDPVDAVLSKNQRQGFIRAFLGEIARDMADNQTEAADEAIISWAAESALGDQVPEDVVRLVVHRAMVMAFLAPDDRPRYRRFSHSQLQNYFLALETIEAINRLEVPKFLRRNVIGADFLITFSEVLDRKTSGNPDQIRSFLTAVLALLRSYRDMDRGDRNLSSLLLASAPAGLLIGKIELKDRQIDDAIVRGTASDLRVEHCSINQLDIRDADLRNVFFVNSQIAGLVINHLSRVNPSIKPNFIQEEDEDGHPPRLILDEDEIRRVLAKRGGEPVDMSASEALEERIKNHPIYDLLWRVLRHRGHWIRENGDDLISAKIVSDVYWSALKEMLARHNFLREEVRQASGRSSTFAHVRNATSLISEKGGTQATAFYGELNAYVGRELNIEK